jgi:hypothetical protein
MMAAFETATQSAIHCAITPDGKHALTGGGYQVTSKLEKDSDYSLRLWRLPSLK